MSMIQLKQFNKLGYCYFTNVLTPKMCTDFTNLMFELKNNGQVRFEGKTNDNPNSFYNKSWGGNHPEFENALRNHVQPQIEEVLQIKLLPRNSFGRIYYNGGTLDRHVDREGLDYTLSISLDSTLNFDWPLWCIDLEGNGAAISIANGDGGFVYGTKMTHWRDPLVCGEDDYVVQLFMHWYKA